MLIPGHPSQGLRALLTPRGGAPRRRPGTLPGLSYSPFPGAYGRKNSAFSPAHCANVRAGRPVTFSTVSITVFPSGGVSR